MTNRNLQLERVKKTERNKLEQNQIERVAIGDMLRRRARDSGNKTAIVGYSANGRSEISYAALNAKANQLARGLREQGIKQGDSLALMATNSIEFFIVMFACYKAGIVVVPINFLQQPHDVHYNFKDANVKAVIALLPFLPLALGDHLTSIKLRVSIGGESELADTTLDKLIDGQDNSDIDHILINDRDTAQLLYSSGTTSQAKGIETSHLALYFASMSTPLSLGFNKDHNHLAVLPTFHCASLCFCLSTLQLGGTLALLPAFDAPTIAQIIQQEKINSTGLLPIMWKDMLALPNLKEHDLTSLTAGLYAMAPMDSNTLQTLRDTFQGCEFHLGSGQSEFTPVATAYYDNTPHEFEDGNYWGVPAIVVDQAIIDDNGNEVPPGETGEICWRGPLVMSRYLNNEQASAQASEFGWHHSGDLGLIDKHGQLLFVDRKKDMIKSGGENVASIKVEQVLLNFDSVLQVAVFGVPHPQWSEAVCAAIELTPGSKFDEQALLAQCKQHLAGYEVPKKIIVLDEFPQTATGKVQKNKLRARYQSLFE